VRVVPFTAMREVAIGAWRSALMDACSAWNLRPLDWTILRYVTHSNGSAATVPQSQLIGLKCWRSFRHKQSRDHTTYEGGRPLSVGERSGQLRPYVRPVARRVPVAELRIWFEAQLAKLPARGPTAEAIRYALNHWDGLQRFLDDGRIELDNNSVERAMRPVALSRKNSLFAGSDEGGENWACLASLIETCKLNRVNPQAYFADLLTRLVNGWPQKRIDELMPWNWAPEKPP
jgi:hypothetical protein